MLPATRSSFSGELLMIFYFSGIGDHSFGFSCYSKVLSTHDCPEKSAFLFAVIVGSRYFRCHFLRSR